MAMHGATLPGAGRSRLSKFLHPTCFSLFEQCIRRFCLVSANNQLALYNSNAHLQGAASSYSPFSANPYQNTMAHPSNNPLMPQPQHQMYPQNPPPIMQPSPYTAPLPSVQPIATAASFDQSTSGNLQLVMLESKQIQNDLRSHVMQVSSKLDQVQQKVDVLAARDTPFGTGNSQVSMEAAVLMQNIHRVVQVRFVTTKSVSHLIPISK